MANYSKGHERDENRLMNKGISRSLFALIFCWLPVAGLLLAIGGFFRIIVRVTEAHRVKKGFCLVMALIILIVCIGALCAEIYFYVRDPSIVDTGFNAAWKAVTGQDQPPWKAEQIEAEPEDPFANYGMDVYSGEESDTDYPFEEDYDMDFDEGYDVHFDEDYDSDFDDSELEDFEAYQNGADDSVSDDEPDQKALFDEMRSTRKSLKPVPMG